LVFELFCSSIYWYIIETVEAVIRVKTVVVAIFIPVCITNILSNKIPQNDIKEMSHKCPTDLKKGQTITAIYNV
jgi:hypothetical protein